MDSTKPTFCNAFIEINRLRREVYKQSNAHVLGRDGVAAALQRYAQIQL